MSRQPFAGLERGDELLHRPGQRCRRVGIRPLSPSGGELLFEVFSQRYERGSTIVTSNLPFDEWTSVFASERLTGALLDRLTHHVHIIEMNGDSYRFKQSKRRGSRTPA
jgi:DNA replication protein DnaC